VVSGSAADDISLEIRIIHVPAQGHLPLVAHAQGPLRLDFCISQGGSSIAARMAMMAMTTKSSIKVKADFLDRSSMLITN